MYEAYWQLRHKPFENSLDPSLLYFSETHHAALLKVQYAIENRREAVALTGASGTGKSLLTRAITRQLPDSFYPIVEVVFPQLPVDQMLHYLADELVGDLTSDSATIEQSIRRIRHFLRENSAAGKHAIVIIDEAHTIRSAESLDALRLLMNLERAATPAFTMVLVGQPPLMTLLDRTPELDDRVDSRCVLRRLSAEETAAYVQHRIQAAGSDQPLFDRTALEQIHRLSDGVPRRINRLCDLSLVVGLADALPNIGAEQVTAVQEELTASRMAA